METINKNISINLKMIRKEKGLTLEDLSGMTGVSKSMLGEIERGGTNPTILVLWKIAEGLKVPLTNIFEEKESECSIVRNDEQKMISTDTGFKIFSLFPYYAPHKLEFHKIEIAPFSKLSNPGHMNGVDEYIVIMEGEIELTFGEFKTLLRKGDAIRFNATTHHEIINNSADTSCMLNVMIYK